MKKIALLLALLPTPAVLPPVQQSIGAVVPAQAESASLPLFSSLPPSIQSSLVGRVVAYMEQKGHQIDREPGQLNIIYLEGVNEDGSPNSNTSNQFNDRRIVFAFENGIPVIKGNWEATVNPGVAYLGVNPKGLPHTQFGQYKAWEVGIHVGASGGKGHEALVQSGPVKVVRCWSGSRPCEEEITKGKSVDGKKVFVEEGEFGINQHWGYNYSSDDISKASAGCLVGRTIEGHKEFMQIVKSDPRYLADKKYKFLTTIIPGWEMR